METCSCWLCKKLYMRASRQETLSVGSHSHHFSRITLTSLQQDHTHITLVGTHSHHFSRYTLTSLQQDPTHITLVGSQLTIANHITNLNNHIVTYISASSYLNACTLCLANITMGCLGGDTYIYICLLYTSPSPRDRQKSRMPSSA